MRAEIANLCVRCNQTDDRTKDKQAYKKKIAKTNSQQTGGNHHIFHPTEKRAARKCGGLEEEEEGRGAEGADKGLSLS